MCIVHAFFQGAQNNAPGDLILEVGTQSEALNIPSFHRMWHNVIISSFYTKDHKHLIVFFNAVLWTWWACKSLVSRNTYQDIYTQDSCNFDAHINIHTWKHLQIVNSKCTWSCLHPSMVALETESVLAEKRKHFWAEKTFLSWENISEQRKHGKTEENTCQCPNHHLPSLFQPIFLCDTYMMKIMEHWNW